jgi:hypothetical protein
LDSRDKIEFTGYSTSPQLIEMAEFGTVLAFEVRVLDKSHRGYKYLLGSNKEILFAQVSIPKGATVVFTHKFAHDLRTDRYKIEAIFDCHGNSMTVGFAPIYHMEYKVGFTYTERNLNVESKESCSRGLHFYSNEKYAADKIFPGACQSGNLDAVRYWINHGAYSFNDGLLIACEIGSTDIANEMITHGANHFNNALKKACGYGHCELAKLMIKHGANKLNHGFIAACLHGHFDLVTLMIGHGANNWDHGLFNACISDSVEIVNLMVEHGATDLNQGLTCACYVKNKEIIARLIQLGASRCDHCKKSMAQHVQIERVAD